MSDTSDHYKVLGLDSTASVSDIKKYVGPHVLQELHRLLF
jgi:hypothetical protein